MRCFIILVIFILISPQLKAGTYYVSPEGDDTNEGTIESPWATIQYACSIITSDTLYIREGTYNESGISFQSGGTAENYALISAFPNEEVLIDGTGGDFNTCFNLQNINYIRISGLEIANYDDHGIWVENSHDFEIADCEIHDVYFGIGVVDGSHDFEINRCMIHHFVLYGFDCSPADNPCYNGTLNDCTSWSGSDPEQNVDGFALGHGEQHDFVLNRCITYNVYDGFDISAKNTTLNRCMAYNCRNGGFKLWQDNIKLVNCLSLDNDVTNVELDWSGDNPKRVRLQNCTFYGSGTFNIWVENASDTLEMCNCILAGGENIGLCFEQSGTTYRADHNIFHSIDTARAIVVAYEDEFSLADIAHGSWHIYSATDPFSFVTVNPEENLFIDATGRDFHLKNGADAIDQGSNDGAPAVDYDGEPRPFGAGIDIGAYEWQGAVNVQQFPDDNALLIYPNPAAEYIEIQIVEDMNLTRGDVLICNITGECKKSIYSNIGRKIRIYISDYPEGVYFLYTGNYCGSFVKY